VFFSEHSVETTMV